MAHVHLPRYMRTDGTALGVQEAAEADRCTQETKGRLACVENHFDLLEFAQLESGCICFFRLCLYAADVMSDMKGITIRARHHYLSKVTPSSSTKARTVEKRQRHVFLVSAVP